MPMSKTRNASALSKSKCLACNDLDPRGHSQSVYNDKLSSKKGSTSYAKQDVYLSLIIDALKLSRLDVKGCRFCKLLANALDAFSLDWRKNLPSIAADVAWSKPVRLTVGNSKTGYIVLEIYCKQGKRTCKTLGMLSIYNLLKTVHVYL